MWNIRHWNTSGVLIVHRYTSVTPCSRTSQYHRTFIPSSVSPWNDLAHPVFDLYDYRVSRALPRHFDWPKLLAHFVYSCSPFLFFLTKCWYCGSGLFGLIGCQSLSIGLTMLVFQIVIQYKIYRTKWENLFFLFWWQFIKHIGTILQQNLNLQSNKTSVEFDLRIYWKLLFLRIVRNFSIMISIECEQPWICTNWHVLLNMRSSIFSETARTFVM